VAALTAWAYLAWVLLTWTKTAEQLLVGAAVALAAGIVLAPLGEVVGPWELLRPRRLKAAVQLMGYAAWWIVVANVKLARRIWSPRLPLESGMLTVPTEEKTDGGLTTVALVTSVIVDNQIVDLDRDESVLQYHAVAIPSRDPNECAEVINAPIERILQGARSPE
jgi:multicomponent Na+:H+ antiporter subunit E